MPASAAVGRRLGEALRAAWRPWVDRVIGVRAAGLAPIEVIEAVCAATAEAIDLDVGGALEAELTKDFAAQEHSPLEVLRGAARYVNAALDAVGVARPARDAQQEQLFPDDFHDVGPASFADLGADVAEAGLAWTAARIAALRG